MTRNSQAIKIPDRRAEFGKKLSSRSGTLKGIIL